MHNKGNPAGSEFLSHLLSDPYPDARLGAIKQNNNVHVPSKGSDKLLRAKMYDKGNPAE
jgi:hypothetical protein